MFRAATYTLRIEFFVLKDTSNLLRRMKTTSLPQQRSRDTELELRFAWLKPVLIGVGLLLGVLTALALWFALAQPVKVLPRIRTMPAFLLTDHAGRPAGDAELRGRMVLLGFSYTRCGAGCAELNRKLQDVRAGLESAGRLGTQLTFATISLDPAHDTPEVLRAYAAETGTDLSSWDIPHRCA